LFGPLATFQLKSFNQADVRNESAFKAAAEPAGEFLIINQVRICMVRIANASAQEKRRRPRVGTFQCAARRDAAVGYGTQDVLAFITVSLTGLPSRVRAFLRRPGPLL
jgi:hypothetical protein